ncbi:MAG: biotin--[acetyl-CoA-carboxylase] ligase [Candidatus Omnitrophota bacterium]|nr:biotin--[acetyl-CoA-carboxylase] ligase [Candidatus Omnitrophota bacterium]
MKEAILKFLRNADGYLSGEEISKSLKISRAGIWKHINELRRDGYEIVAIPHLGYSLASMPDKLFPAEIQNNLNTKILGKKIYHYEMVSSAMDVAFDLAIKGAQEGAVILAEGQQKGRGRMGRTWASPKGKGIYMSIILRPRLLPNETPKLTLLAGVAVSQALRKVTGLELFIKWPNDILIKEKKVGGILTELNAELDSVKFAVLGIGINVNTRKTFLPQKATSLKEELGRNISRIELTKQILRELDNFYLLFERQGFSSIIELWRQISSTLGKRIKVVSQKNIIEGVAVDIDSQGALLIRKDSGFVTRVISGDVVGIR